MQANIPRFADPAGGDFHLVRRKETKQRLPLCALAILLGLGLTLALAAAPLAAPDIRCVNATGTGCGGACGGCYASIQAAINAANPDDEIRVAGGTYTDTVGTVAVITKELTIDGAYDPAFTVPDPELYPTMLDANWGGSVISITNAGDVLLRHLIIAHGDGTGNCFSTAGCGGGIYVKNTSLHVGGCEIVDNVGSRARWGAGGGIYACDSTVEMQNSRVVSNTACADPLSTNTAYGGGVYVGSFTGTHSVSLRDSQFLDNVGHISDQGQGGGIYLFGVAGTEVLTNTIRGNKATLGNATSGWGGGLYIERCSGVDVAGNRIENNVTHPNLSYGGYGGGVYVYGSDAHLARNTIVGNTTSQGGGVFIRSEQAVTLSNNLIASNLYSGVHVTEYYAPSCSRALLVNNTIADNGSSGVVAHFYAVVTLTNDLIAGHAIGINAPTPFSGTVSADTNLFWNTSDPITGTNGIRLNPLLSPDYHPHAGSPAIDAGLTMPWLTTDLEGNLRPQGSGYDIGAFEGAGVGWEVFLPLVLKNQ
jgi:hypothetical protein